MNCKVSSIKYLMSVLLVLIISSILFVLPSSASAERKGEDLHTKINLTPKQREKFLAQRLESKKKTEKATDDLQKARTELSTQLRQYKLDKNKVDTSIRKVNNLQRNLLNIKLENQVALRHLLTSDQFDRLREIVRGMGVDHESTMGPRDAMRINGANIRDLKLSKTQQEQIKKLFNKSKKTTTPLRSHLRDRSHKLHKLYMSYKLDQKQAKVLIDDIANTRLKMLKATADRQQQVRTVLTEKQFNELAKAMRPPGERRRRHREHRDE